MLAAGLPVWQDCDAAQLSGVTAWTQKELKRRFQPLTKRGKLMASLKWKSSGHLYA